MTGIFNRVADARRYGVRRTARKYRDPVSLSEPGRNRTAFFRRGSNWKIYTALAIATCRRLWFATEWSQTANINDRDTISQAEFSKFQLLLESRKRFGIEHVFAVGIYRQTIPADRLRIKTYVRMGSPPGGGSNFHLRGIHNRRSANIWRRIPDLVTLKVYFVNTVINWCTLCMYFT